MRCVRGRLGSVKLAMTVVVPVAALCRRSEPRRSVWRIAAVRELVEADRLLQVRRRADLRLLVVAQDGGAAVAVDRVAAAGGPGDRALQVRGQRRVERRGGVAERRCRTSGRPGSPCRRRPGGAAPIVPPAMPSSVCALRLRAERVLDDRREHVRDAADVRRRSCTSGRCAPSTSGSDLLASWTRSKTFTVPRLQRGAAGRARAEDVGQELPRRVGLDRRADADEAAALAEVRLEVRCAARR